jgi:hypothetical protein
LEAGTAFAKLVPSFLLLPSPTQHPLVHMFDEPQFNPQDGYIGFMLDFFRKLRDVDQLFTDRWKLEQAPAIISRFFARSPSASCLSPAGR